MPVELTVAADPAGAYYAAMARAREFAATLTAEGQARARALPLPHRPSNAMGAHPGAEVAARAAKESEIPNFKGSYLGRFPLVAADFWTSDHLSERSRSVDVFFVTRARGTLTLKRR